GQHGVLLGRGPGYDRYGAVEPGAPDLVGGGAAGGAVVRPFAHDLLQRTHLAVDRRDEDLLGLAGVGDGLLRAEAHRFVLAEDGDEIVVERQKILHLPEPAVGAPVAPA